MHLQILWLIQASVKWGLTQGALPQSIRAYALCIECDLTRTLLQLAAVACAATSAFAAEGARVEGKNIRIEFDSAMHSRVVALFAGRERVIGDFSPSEFIRVSGKDISDFAFQGQRSEPVRDALGRGTRTILTGTGASLKKVVTVTVYDDFPRTAIFNVAYTNTGKSDLDVNGWTNQHYSIGAPASAAQPAFWSYQSGSYEKRPDWVLPLKPGFKQENFLGMNAPDYGGRHSGSRCLAPGRGPRRRSFGDGAEAGFTAGDPEERDRATVAVAFLQNQVLKPGATINTFRTFAAVHEGDYFQTLARLPRKDGGARS